jgi:hypothetical protein
MVTYCSTLIEKNHIIELNNKGKEIIEDKLCKKKKDKLGTEKKSSKIIFVTIKFYKYLNLIIKLNILYFTRI